MKATSTLDEAFKVTPGPPVDVQAMMIYEAEALHHVERAGVPGVREGPWVDLF